ncbi:hypothetical protein GCM10017687_66890 [Streptomyces echinatus]
MRLLLDVGDADDPSGEDESVQGEEGSDRNAQCRKPLTWHDAVRSGFVHCRHKMQRKLGTAQGQETGRPGTGTTGGREAGAIM